MTSIPYKLFTFFNVFSKSIPFSKTGLKISPTSFKRSKMVLMLNCFIVKPFFTSQIKTTKDPFASAFSADDGGKCSLNKDNKDSNDSEEEDVDINDELRTLTDQISDTSRNNYLLAKLYEEEKQAKSKM